MWQTRLRASALSSTALASLLFCTASGCDGGGPAGLPPASLPDLFGSQLYRADGSEVGIQVLDEVAVIGIYFASPGCPACGGFTPLLVDAYNQLREDGRSFEVVLVSLGVDDSSLFEYMVASSMPWLAVSSQSEEATALVQRYDVRWVPTLIIIDGAGNTISFTGREELTQSGIEAYDGWFAASAGA